MASAQTFSPIRYDDDVSEIRRSDSDGSIYKKIKFLSLDSDSEDFVSFGGDDRERGESSQKHKNGLAGTAADRYALHRLLLFADVEIESARAFLQLGNHTEFGRSPAALPTDVNRVDVQQAFLDYKINVSTGLLTLRAGRAEMAFDEGGLIGTRDGPNVRQVWDGVRTFLSLGDARVDAFLVGPVDVKPGTFDDKKVSGERLLGVHVEIPATGSAPVKFNGFYYDSTMPAVSLSSGTATERTHTVGLRLRSVSGSVDASLGAIGQTGTFAQTDVRAWSAHVDAGYTFDAPWSPRIGFRSDVLSGGDDRSGVTRTFNALYPNYAFSTEATIESPANLIQHCATLRVSPNPTLSAQITFERLWRYSTKDAFYAAPLFPLVKPDADGRSFSGTEQQVEATWQRSKYVSFTAAYAHIEPGAFVRSVIGASENFKMVEVSLRF